MYRKLPKEFKADWLKALRSGKYKQGIGRLEQSDGNGKGKLTYCCLGVACKMLYRKERITGTIIEDGAYLNVPDILRGGASENRIVAELTEMNDGDENGNNMSFKKIADWIEKNL